MTYTIEDNHLTEEKQIFDHQGLSYTLDILNSYDQQCSRYSLIMNLIRDNRDCRVGNADCIVNSSEDALLGDIQIFDNVPFDTINDKIYHFFYPNEPTNYQQRGLGTILLKKIINFVRLRQVKKLHGSLTRQDLSKNPKLIQWYQKHGFQIEKPTSDEATTAIHRVCLYLEY